MAYKTEDLLDKAKKAIQENEIFFIEDIVAFLPCSKPTFYDHFPVNSDEFNDLKEMLNTNKIKTKQLIRRKLMESPKASELLAVYRLICTDEERKMLNQSYIDVTSKGNEVQAPRHVIFKNMDDEATE